MSLSKASNAFADYLNETFGGVETYLHSRASGLLYRFLLGFGQQGTGVLIPSASGFSLPQIVISAGYIPIFADVQNSDFNLSVSDLHAASRNSQCRITVCIAIHSFGHFLNLEPIANFCEQNQILLIEDICQLIGTGSEGKHGDLVLASFGKHKSLDGGAGGALIIRNRKYSFDFYEDVIPSDYMGLVSTQIESNFISSYYKLRENEKNGASRGNLSSLTSSNLKYIVNGSVDPDWNYILQVAQNIFDDNEIRRRNSNYLYEELSLVPDIFLPEYAIQSVPWRFTFVCKDFHKRDALVAELRNKVVHTSTWYSSLSLDFIEYAFNSTPVSDMFEKSVINLLVDKTVTQDYLRDSVNTIRNYFK